MGVLWDIEMLGFVWWLNWCFVWRVECYWIFEIVEYLFGLFLVGVGD